MTAPLQSVFAVFKSKVDDKALKQGKVAADRFGESLQKAGSYLALFFGAQAVRGFVTGLIETGDELHKASAALGLTTDALQELRFAAGQSAGTRGVMALREGLSQLSAKAVAAAQGSAEARRIFETLGVSVTGTDGRMRSLDEILSGVADGLARTEGDAQRLGLAVRLVGGAGRDLLPFLSSGADGVNALRQEFRDLGGGLSTGAIDAAARAQDSLGRLDAVVESLKGSIAEELLPNVEAFVEFVRKGLQRFTELTRGVDKMRLAFILLSPVLTAIALKGLAALLNPAGLIALSFIAIALAVEDLITSYETGDGAIADFFDAHFDVDVIGFLDELREAWEVLLATIEAMPDAWDAILNGFLAFENGALAGLARVLAAVNELGDALLGGNIVRALGGETLLGNTAQNWRQIGEDARARQGTFAAAEQAAQDRQRAIVQAGIQRGAAARVEGVQRRAAYQAQFAGTGKGAVGSTVTVNNSVNVSGLGLTEQQTQRVVDRAIERQTRQLEAALDAGEP